MRIIRSFIVRLVISYAVIIAINTLLSIFYISHITPRSAQVAAMITLTVLTTLLAAVMTYLHYVTVMTPLKNIDATTRKISEGNYGTRIKDKFFDSQIGKMADNINKIAGEFENLEEMRRSFVASASHELRSPLTSMQGFLQGIIDGTIPEQDKVKFLNIVYAETRRLSTLVTSMLDLSRMESGKYPLNMSRFDINELIRRVIIRFEPHLLKKELQLDVDFVNAQTFVFADKDKIEQVLINLIDNAIKYSPSMSKIIVVTHIHAKKIYVSVKDKGIGINKKDQLLIWDRFYMADKARTPVKSKGTGLGLSIVKKIIDEHKEIIWVESTRNVGSTFIFTLSIFDPVKHKQAQSISS